MPKYLEITGIYQGDRFRFENADGDTIIGSVFVNSDINAVISVKGQAEIDELMYDQAYRFYGHWTTYKNKRTGIEEKQFAFSSFVLEAPATREAVVLYLLQHGAGHGFGRSRAVKLWEIYGPQAVKVLREEPQIAAAAVTAEGLKLTGDVAEIIAEKLRQEQAVESCTLDLVELMTGRGFPKSTTKKAIKEWGNRAGNIIRRDPFKLMRFRGCGFKRCDALYLELKLPPTRLKRQALCGWYAVASNTEGHTWFPAGVSEKYIEANIHPANAQLALRLAVRGRALSEIHSNGATGPIATKGIRWLAEYRKANHEKDLADLVGLAMHEPHNWPDVATLPDIDDHQRERLTLATSGAIGILGGSPGTGKTYTAAAMIKALVGTVGLDSILVGAPTGKAAVRVTENLARYGLPIRARTWHSLLRGGPDGEFEHGKSSPWSAKVLVGDEMSMTDTDLFCAVMRARPRGCHFLIVGDVNQLPPVGHGAPLRDLIAAGLPYGELREIKRNSGGIVETCAAIRDNKPWQGGDNLILIQPNTPTAQIEAMIRTIREQHGRNPIWDIQVLVAVNKKSPLCRKELNSILQRELNQAGHTVPGSPFKIGDKIVNTRNAFFPAVEFDAQSEDATFNNRGEVYVANGELGRVVQVEEKLTIAQLDNPRRTVKIPRGKQQEAEGEEPAGDDNDGPATGCSWDLAYALSVHKAQGSEFGVVIVMVDEHAGAKRICTREFFYTAISRAKDKCYLIGKKSTVEQGCRTVAIGRRKTMLKERILLARSQDELAEL